jgi:hypothetical protein
MRAPLQEPGRSLWRVFRYIKGLALKNPEFDRTISPTRLPEPERIARRQIYDAPRFSIHVFSLG